MCFCCTGFKSADEIYDIGSERLQHADLTSLDIGKNVSASDVKAFIAALKILQKAADQGHSAACYLLGLTFSRCYRFQNNLKCSFELQERVATAFRRTLSKSEFDYDHFQIQNQRSLSPSAATLYRAIAWKYLGDAARLMHNEAGQAMQAILDFEGSNSNGAIDFEVEKLKKQGQSSTKRGFTWPTSFQSPFPPNNIARY